MMSDIKNHLPGTSFKIWTPVGRNLMVETNQRKINGLNFYLFFLDPQKFPVNR